MSDTDGLVAYAAWTARQLVADSVPQDCLTITTYRTKNSWSGFLKRETRRVPGPDETKPFGWLLWSHQSSAGNAWVRSGRQQPTHEWTITRGWWLAPSGVIDVIDHRSEYIYAAVRYVHRVEGSHPASMEELVDPDRPWSHWGEDDKRSPLYERGWSPDCWVTPPAPGRRLRAELTALRKPHGTYQPKRP